MGYKISAKQTKPNGNTCIYTKREGDKTNLNACLPLTHKSADLGSKQQQR